MGKKAKEGKSGNAVQYLTRNQVTQLGWLLPLPRAESPSSLHTSRFDA